MAMNATMTAMMSMLSTPRNCGLLPKTRSRYGDTTPSEMTGSPTQHPSMSTAMKPMANHSVLCTPASTLSAFCATPASLPSHFAQ